jgi:hypothetical protein
MNTHKIHNTRLHNVLFRGQIAGGVAYYYLILASRSAQIVVRIIRQSDYIACAASTFFGPIKCQNLLKTKKRKIISHLKLASFLIYVKIIF